MMKNVQKQTHLLLYGTLYIWKLMFSNSFALIKFCLQNMEKNWSPGKVSHLKTSSLISCKENRFVYPPCRDINYSVLFCWQTEQKTGLQHHFSFSVFKRVLSFVLFFHTLPLTLVTLTLLTLWKDERFNWFWSVAQRPLLGILKMF